jgi:hypothetical protein
LKEEGPVTEGAAEDHEDDEDEEEHYQDCGAGLPRDIERPGCWYDAWFFFS